MSGTIEEKRKRRQMRRWKRRMRIIAPFAGVPLLLATLMVSVDMIEYRPEKPREKLADQPISDEALEARSEVLNQTHSSKTRVVSTPVVDLALPNEGASRFATGADVQLGPIDLDIDIPQPRALRPPKSSR